MNYKLLIPILLLLVNFLYGKENVNTYCFESQNIHIGQEHVKRLSLTFDDNNLSGEYQVDVPLYITLDTDETYPSDPVNCYYEGNDTFNCNQEMDGVGYLEFDIKKKRINIEHLCTYECYVHISQILEDGRVIIDKFSDDNQSSNPDNGDLNTMLDFQDTNNEDEKVWVEGYKCDVQADK